MKYERTERFKRDYRRLSPGEKDEFKHAVLEHFAPAAEQQAEGTGWPPKLRVRGVQGATGVWEMTWSFTDPDGRATFEWVKIDGDPGIRWRRVGGRSLQSGHA